MKAKRLREKFQEENPELAQQLQEKAWKLKLNKPRQRVYTGKQTKIRNMIRRGRMDRPDYRAYSVQSRHPHQKSATAQLRTLPQDKVETLVIAAVKAQANQPRKPSIPDYVTKESIAHEINCKVHQVAIVFAKLNRLGILAQKTRRFAHDTQRNSMFPGPESGWSANTYHILDNASQKLDELTNAHV